MQWSKLAAWKIGNCYFELAQFSLYVHKGGLDRHSFIHSTAVALSLFEISLFRIALSYFCTSVVSYFYSFASPFHSFASPFVVSQTRCFTVSLFRIAFSLFRIALSHRLFCFAGSLLRCLEVSGVFCICFVSHSLSRIFVVLYFRCTFVCSLFSISY